jgi:hypothetical protein
MSIQRIATEIRIVSLVGLGAQVLLGTIPAIWLLLTSVNRSINPIPIAQSGGNWGMAILALIALAFSIGWWVMQYRMSKWLLDRDRRPPRARVIKSLQAGLAANLFGMILVILAALGYAWFLFIKVLGTPRGAVMIQPNALVPTAVFSQLDAITILAIVHTLAAELVGILGYFWLLQRVRAYQPERQQTGSEEFYYEEYVE